jgi:sugar transferase (PEP-CTERM/EpsH1 system associated)
VATASFTSSRSAGGAVPRAPLIAHVVQHFDVGGLENGMVNLINGIPAERYRHAVICLDAFTDYRNRIGYNAVVFHALHKQPGKDFGVYRRLWRVLRDLRPDIVHTRNLSALEGQFVAALAGVRARVHGEHGRDVFDLHGASRKYNALRRAARPFVKRYIAVSKDLARWLVDVVGVDPARVTQIYNGVDTARFRPRAEGERRALPDGFRRSGQIVVGSVGRMAAVKDYPTLVRAFLALIGAEPALRQRLRLVIAGEGPARAECLALLEAAGAAALAWLPGERSDVPELMRAFDLFVLPSLGEGISNTILEAMATGLPVVATRVGGNPELVENGVTGALVEPGSPKALAAALRRYVDDPGLAQSHAANARRSVEERFSIDAMVAGYLAVYDGVLGSRKRGATKADDPAVAEHAAPPADAVSVRLPPARGSS